MLRKLIALTLLLGCTLFAQQQPTGNSSPAGIFYAPDYNTGQGFLVFGNNSAGVNPVVIAGNSASGGVQLGDGTLIPIGTYFNISALSPLTLEDANLETVTPSAMTIAPCPPSNLNSGGRTQCITFTGNFSNTHGQMVVVKSGTLGLQEAINVATFSGGGIVVVDSSWGGTTAMITGAFGNSSVGIQDNRTGQIVQYQWNGSIYAPVGSSGGGTVASAFVSPPIINFGTVRNNTPSPSQSIIITNSSSTLNLTVNSVVLSDPHFTSPNIHACDGVILPGAQCPVPIVFTPTAAPLVTATATVNTTAAINPIAPPVVLLFGSGTVTPTFLLTIAPDSSTGTGIVTSDEATTLLNCSIEQINTRNSCSASYASGSVVNLTANAGLGTFGSFSGGGCSSSPCPVTITANTTVTATFNAPVPNFVVNLAVQGQGSGTLLSDLSSNTGILNCVAAAGVASSAGNAGCSGSYPQGSVITVTEAPSAGSNFAGWSGPCTGTSTTCQITVNSNVTLAANFGLSVPPISLVQATTNCSVASTTIACTWANAMNAGDTVMCVGAWPDASTTVSSIADTKGNTYTQFPTISPKVGTGITQVGYYAQNIAAATLGANTTTMTLSAGVGQISGTNLTTGGTTTPATSFNTASITPTANRLVTLSVATHLGSSNGPGPVSSVTGAGLTWVFAGSKSYGPSTGTGQTNRIEVWRAMGSSPSAGALTISYGTSPSVISWSVSQFTGMDTTGTNGSGAIGIVASAGADVVTATPLSVTMGTFGAATSGTFGAGTTDGASTVSAGASMSILGTNGSFNSVSDEFATGNVSPVTFNYSGGTLRWGILGIEIKVPTNRRDMRCLEYAGIKATGGTPIDQSIAATGTGTAVATGTITTGAANDLLTGFTASLNSVSSADTSHNWVQRLKNTFGDDAEDQQGVPVAAYNFQPTLGSSANWVAFNIGWLNGGGGVSNTVSLTVFGAGSGQGTVTSNTGSPILNCFINVAVQAGPTCSSGVSLNSTVTLTAAPNTGSSFVNWGGVQGCGTSPTCIVPNITANANVTANFTSSGAANFYMASATNTPPGNDNNSGTDASHPWLTFTHAQAALTQGSTGTIIHIATCPTASPCFSGTFNLGLSGLSANQRITWTSDTPQGAKFNGVFNAYGDFVAVQNLDIEDTATASDGITTLFNGNPKLFGSFGWFLNNYVHDVQFSTSAGCLGGNSFILISPGSHDFIVNGNTGLRAGNWGGCSSTGGTSAHGLYISGYHGTVTNNIVSNAAGYGIEMYHNACENVVANNTLFHNFSGGIQIAAPADGLPPCATTIGSDDYTSINNNLIVHNGFCAVGSCTQTSHPHQPIIVSSGTGAHNKIFGNFMAGNLNENGVPANALNVNGGTTPITGSPANFGQASTTGIFVNYQDDGSGNYHLTAGSPAINAGTSGNTNCAVLPGITTNCIPALDFAGAARVNADIGAYKF